MGAKSSKILDVKELRQSLERMDKMTITELNELSKQLNTILSRKKIKDTVKYKNYEDRYEVLYRNGKVVSRNYIGRYYVGTSSIYEDVDLSVENVKSLVGVLNAVKAMIEIRNEEMQIKLKIICSIKTLNHKGNDPNLIISQDEALDLAIDFLGPFETTGPLKSNSDSFLRLISADGKRQVRFDLECKQTHCKGKPHFNFEILDKEYLKELNKELDFEVKSNYHLFIDYKSSNQQKDDKVK